MKITRFLLPALFFSLCLLLGYPAGVFLSNHVFTERQPDESVGSPTPIDTLPNGQSSILLIIADRLDKPSPQLESIWLMSYVTNNTTLNLLPVYPTEPETGDRQDYDLRTTFSIASQPEGNLLALEFLQALQKQVPWWSGYLVLDETSLARLIDAWFQGVKVSNAQDPEKTLAGLPHAWENPETAITQHARLYQQMCRAASQQNKPIDLSRLLRQFPTHLISDLDTGQLQNEIQALHGQMGKYSCEFPTLAIPGSVIGD